MSCTIYLVRHGIAADPTAGMNDADRALTPAGGRKMTRIATGLKRLGAVPDVILSSPLRRAEETAALLATVLTPDRAAEIYPPLAPGHGATDILKGLQVHRRAHAVMLVGHQPDMGEFASFLLSGSAALAQLDFKKGGVAAIAVPALPPRSSGMLRWFLTPKQLRFIGRSRC
jgi:phosphohistidine phosphatase